MYSIMISTEESKPLSESNFDKDRILEAPASGLSDEELVFAVKDFKKTLDGMYEVVGGPNYGTVQRFLNLRSEAERRGLELSV